MWELNIGSMQGFLATKMTSIFVSFLLLLITCLESQCTRIIEKNWFDHSASAEQLGKAESAGQMSETTQKSHAGVQLRKASDTGEEFVLYNTISLNFSYAAHSHVNSRILLTLYHRDTQFSIETLWNWHFQHK